MATACLQARLQGDGALLLFAAVVVVVVTKWLSLYLLASFGPVDTQKERMRHLGNLSRRLFVRLALKVRPAYTICLMHQGSVML